FFIRDSLALKLEKLEKLEKTRNPMVNAVGFFIGICKVFSYEKTFIPLSIRLQRQLNPAKLLSIPLNSFRLLSTPSTPFRRL
ncbi:MAG: hypothetical protein QMC22_08035, partial [Pseudomonadales bacterium]